MAAVDIRDAWCNVDADLVDVIGPGRSTLVIEENKNPRRIRRNNVAADIVALSILLAQGHDTSILAVKKRVRVVLAARHCL